jgi:outer membrane protein OmpA-like peptidoglycan-associated protein
MSAPPTPDSGAWLSGPTGRQRRGRPRLLVTMLLAGVLVVSTPTAATARQDTTTTTLPGGSATTLPGTTAAAEATTSAAGTPGQAGVGIDVVPRVIDLVFRTSRVNGGKDTATVSEAPGTTEVDLAADVLFAFDSARLTPAAQAELADTAQLIRDRAKGAVRVEGHTDSVGSPSYNLDLSQRRAQAVHDALAKLLADRPTQFQVRGFGATKPVAANKHPDGSDNPTGRAKNRRVSIAIST